MQAIAFWFSWSRTRSVLGSRFRSPRLDLPTEHQEIPKPRLSSRALIWSLCLWFAIIGLTGCQQESIRRKWRIEGTDNHGPKPSFPNAWASIDQADLQRFIELEQLTTSIDDPNIYLELAALADRLGGESSRWHDHPLEAIGWDRDAAIYAWYAVNAATRQGQPDSIVVSIGSELY